MLTVWVDSWQMRCCGTPFAVGREVAWTLSKPADREFAAAVLGPVLADRLTHHEEHHGGLPEDAPVTRGIVRSIKAASCTYAAAQGSKTMYPVADSLLLSERTSADGWEPETDDYTFVAYVVELEVAEAG